MEIKKVICRSTSLPAFVLLGTLTVQPASVCAAEEPLYAGVNGNTILTYSGDNELDDRFSDYVPLNDGGYAVCGTTDSEKKGGYGDTFCIRYDSEGNLIWRTIIQDALLPSMIQTEQGFLLAGNADSRDDIFGSEKNYGDGDAAAVLLDSDGNSIWGVQLGGSDYDSFGASYYTKTNSPVVLDNGNFLIGGTFSSDDGIFENLTLGGGDGFLAELSSTDGSLVNVTPIGGSAYDTLTSLDRTEDGGFIISGTTSSTDGLFDGLDDWTEGYTYVAKLNVELQPVWVKAVNTHDLSWGAGASVLSDGNILLATGQVDADYNTEEQSNVTLIKYDSEGNELWSKDYEAGPFNYVVSITPTDTATALFITETYDEDGNMCSLIGEVNETGDLLWSTLYETGSSILVKARKTADGQFVSTGYKVAKEGDYQSVLMSYQPVTDAASLVPEETGTTEVSKENVVYKDGIYDGVGRGLYSGLHVTVTIKDGNIEDIELGDYRDDSPYIDNAAEGVIPAIIEAQSVDVDAVTGATYSSKGIKAAVAYALEKAAE